MNERKPLSLLIIVFGIALFFSYHIYYHFVSKVNDNLIDKYYEQETKEKETLVSVKNTNKIDDEYIGVLTIPKINLEEGFYEKDSSNNNVSKSVTILDDSIMPSEKNSIVYLAAHSGTGHLAYFKDINKLTIDDMIYLNYSNTKYSYSIADIYELPRNGKITIDRNINEKYLVLTTCSKNQNMQLVIVSKMLNKV